MRGLRRSRRGEAALALYGTFDTIGLADVLHLLAATDRCGCLQVDSERGAGRLWLHTGAIAASEVTWAALGDSFDEAMFQLLRLDVGAFSFDPEPDAHRCPESGHDVHDALQRAQAAVAEWRHLRAVVPSLDHRVHLAATLATDAITLDSRDWPMVVAAAGVPTVGEMAARLGLGEVTALRAVADLLDRRVAVLTDPTATTTRTFH